ncbi:MAG: phage major capsid protein [Ruminococcus sp.]|nr:phage major capsid protein [Ruminococcus sp.]
MNEKKIKALTEERGKLMNELAELMTAIDPEGEIRALSEESKTRFDEIEEKVKEIDRILDMEKRADKMRKFEAPDIPESDVEVRAGKEIIGDFVRGAELRAGEMTTTSTGGVIPADFSEDIISKTTELSGVLQRVSVVNSTGTYKQIIADNEEKISAGWVGEIEDITSSTAKFKTVEIGHHKLAALAKISLELINQNAFDIAGEIENQMMKDFALKAETAIIKGDGKDKPVGLTSSGVSYELASKVSITADDIVQIYHSLKSPYQQNAVWIMSNATLCAVRMLTDGAGRYIFHQSENLTEGYAGYILGKPVLVSEAMDEIEAGGKPILFGDFGRAYKVNINPEMTMQILNEAYAAQGMKGIISILWLDGRPVNEEAYVTVKCADKTADEGGESTETVTE